jgi:hypothetical protein
MGPRGMGIPMDSRCQKGPNFWEMLISRQKFRFLKKKWKEMEDFCDPNGKIILNQWISVDVPAMLGDSRLGMNHPG